MFIITPAEVAAIAEAYRASGSLEAAAAALRARFRALTESQARHIAAQILGVPQNLEDPSPANSRRSVPPTRPEPDAMTGPVYSVMEKQDYRSRWLPAVPALEPSLKGGLIRPQVRHDTKTLLMARQQTGLGRQPRMPLRPGTLFR